MPIRAVMLSRLGPNVWAGTPAAAMARARGARGNGAPVARRRAQAGAACRPSRSTSCAATSARAGEPERRNAMPRFAANLSMMYTEHAFLDRFAAAARDGFRAVEFLFPVRLPGGDDRQGAARQRPAAGALQRAAGRLRRRRARHRQPGRARGGVQERLRARARLRRGARLPARARHGRARAAPAPIARRCGGSIVAHLALGRASARRAPASTS